MRAPHMPPSPHPDPRSDGPHACMHVWTGMAGSKTLPVHGRRPVQCKGGPGALHVGARDSAGASARHAAGCPAAHLRPALYRQRLLHARVEQVVQPCMAASPAPSVVTSCMHTCMHACTITHDADKHPACAWARLACSACGLLRAVHPHPRAAPACLNRVHWLGWWAPAP